MLRLILTEVGNDLISSASQYNTQADALRKDLTGFPQLHQSGI